MAPRKKSTRQAVKKKAKKPQGGKISRRAKASPQKKRTLPTPPSRGSLPESYPFTTQQNQAMLLTADPVFVFIYWSVDQGSYEKILKRVGPSAKMTLRFYDITTSLDLSRSPQWDLDIFDLAGNWYLKREHPQQKLCFDLGIKNAAGDFYSVCRSNILHLPTPSLATTGAAAAPSLPMSSEELKSALGPYFFELFEKGRMNTIANTSLAGIFHDISLLRHEKPAASTA